ncbi:cytochrome P450 [archaeon]|nr:MAG: cytochrome P450 [archaeon]
MEEAFLAFGSGPRVCPGMSLAILESVLAIAYIVKNFSIELACDAAEVTRVMRLTSTPNKMPIRLTRLV